MRLPFHHGITRLLIRAFSSPSVSPHAIAQRVLKTVHRPCGRREGDAFLSWLSDRKISRLVHFTPLANVPKITQYGLIPREYLELEVVRLALGSQFTDGQRMEAMPHYSCLSITSPNYAMFFGKRQKLGGRWAVIEFNSNVLARFHFTFTPTNAAAKGVEAKPGVGGAELLFSLPDLRVELELSPCEPTDPQAESLCDSLLGPEYITGIHVENETDIAWLGRKGVSASMGVEYFRPRRDNAFWRGRKITDLLLPLRGMTG